MINTNEFARKIRMQALRMVHRAKASHIASCLSIADIVSVLYGGVLNVDSTSPRMESRDRFILSKGHAAAIIYSALAELCFIKYDDLEFYGLEPSLLMTHISHKIPGVEFSTGSLGHGLPFGVGKALAAKSQNKSWKVYVILSDGELDEGSNWEAFLFASHHKLNNLNVIIDRNRLQSLTTTENTLGLEPLLDKLIAFGWEAQEMDGHNHSQLIRLLGESASSDKPRVFIANTIKGKGVSFMENKVEWHYKSPSDEQLKDALQELDTKNA